MKYTCKQCGKEFEITDGEAEFYRSKGLNLPKRCKECREKNKAEKSGSTSVESKPVKTAVTAKMPVREASGPNFDSKTLKIAASVVAAVLVVIAGLVSIAGRNSSDKKEYESTSSEYEYSYDEYDYDDYDDEYTESEEYEDGTSDTEETLRDRESIDDRAENQDDNAVVSQTSSGQTTAKKTTSGQSATKQTTTTKKATITKQTTTTKKATTTKQTTTTKKVTTTKQATTSASRYRFRNDNLLQQHFQKHGAEVGASSADEYQRMAAAVITSSGVQHKYEAEDGDDVYFKASTGEFVVVSTDGYIRTYYIATQDYFDRQ